jgi:N6-adenosine-specific RNA methylase IME4
LLGSRGAASKYPTLTVDEIKAFPLSLLAPDAFLFLWRLASMPQEALDVVRAWGFVPKTEIVWRKMSSGGKPWFGLGRYTRAAHETCILATRGRPKVATRNIRSVFTAAVPTIRGRAQHSAKPAIFYDLVERLCGAGPYVELFARSPREGWLQLGNQVGHRAPSGRILPVQVELAAIPRQP